VRQDFVGCLGPGERVAAVVPAVDEGADRGDELSDAVKRSTADRLAGDDPEEHLDGVEPRPRCRGEVQRDLGVFGQPLVDVVVLVGVVVVDDDVQLAAGVGAGDLLREVQELGSPRTR
jgi:hypothetical protein